MRIAMTQYKAHKGSSAGGWPVFNLEKSTQSNALYEGLHIKGFAEQQSKPATGLQHSTLLEKSTEYYHCGSKRTSKAPRNLSAPKPRPSAQSITDESSRRVNSMRLIGTSRAFTANGLPLDWRDDSHPSLSQSSRKVGRTINVNTSWNSSIAFSKPSSQELPSKAIKPHASARQQSPASAKTKATFKYLNAKTMAEKLVKALTKDRTSLGETEKGNYAETQKGKKGKQDLLETETGKKLPMDGMKQGVNGESDGHVDAGNGHQGPLPMFGEEKYNNDTRFLIVNPTSTSKSITVYDVMDPLEAKAQSFEDQAAMLGTGNELSDVVIRTLVDHGECEYDTLEIHIDVLKREFRRHIEDKRELALQMAAELRGRLRDRTAAEEASRKVRTEAEAKVRVMEREMVEMKNRLQEEMEESEAEWALKFEKLRSKEKRLSERLKEILEEKVELHKEVSSLTTKKNALVEEVKGYQESMKGLKETASESKQEVAKLRNILEESMATRTSALEGSKVTEKALERSKLTDEEWTTLVGKYRQKEKELMEKQRVIGKLQKLCKDQEKTIAGLRFALGEQADNAPMQGKGEFFIKLQRELVRLSGIEQGLRKEVEAYKAEALAAKRENATLNERLGSILKKLGNAAIKMADYRDDTHVENAMKPSSQANSAAANHGDNGNMLKLEDKYGDAVLECDHQAAEFLENNSLALVLLGQPAKEPAANLSGPLNNKDGIIRTGQEGHHKEGEEVEELRKEVNELVQNRARLQQESSNLHNALSLTNRRVQELEAQLVSKEQELEGVQEELERLREQKDNVQKDAEYMGREAIRLSAQVDELSRRVEKLDEDVMVKDGQLSILRGALHDNSE